MARFPNARLIAPKGLSEKYPQLHVQGWLNDEQLAGWPPEIERLPIAGAPVLDEFAFYHSPTRSLLIADLLFNIHRSHSWMETAVYWRLNIWKTLTVSRSWNALIQDASATQASIERMLDRPIDRVIFAHGDVLQGNVTDQLRRALARLR